jgi:hypothetical protein
MPDRRSLLLTVAVPLLLASSGLVVGDRATSAWSATATGDGTPSAVAGAATPDPAVAALRPAPGFGLSGRVAVEALPNGDALLWIEARGPVEELGEEIPLWHIGQGTCDAWGRASVERPSAGEVLYRFNPPVQSPGRQSFDFVVAATHATPPLVLAAFEQGGGPMMACADLPLAPAVPPGSPVATPRA